MKFWEYKVVEAYADPSQVTVTLINMGVNAWELVSVIKGNSGYTLFFKRQLGPQTGPGETL